MSPRLNHKCLKCGGTWVSIVPLPNRCARCGTRGWYDKKHQITQELAGAYVVPEKLPFGEPCWLYYKKGSASGGHAKIGKYIGVGRTYNKMPEQVKIAASHKGWEGD